MNLPYRRRDPKEENMFEVTEKADNMIKDFIKDKGAIPGIRLFMAQGG
jgi:Fe-S cluster assembly iron-binding protein IscA